MRFDDRLLTVLNQPAGDRHDAAVRWRQLVDLVARAGPNSASPVVAQALADAGHHGHTQAITSPEAAASRMIVTGWSNLTATAEDDWLGTGIAETISAYLS